MYQELELWKAEQAKINQLDKAINDLCTQDLSHAMFDKLLNELEAKLTKPEPRPDKDQLLSAALAECFAMGV